jgi:hypothetical protein
MTEEMSKKNACLCQMGEYLGVKREIENWAYELAGLIKNSGWLGGGKDLLLLVLVQYCSTA